ncbi:hypothetical protein chiPu_0016951 [Chiloscyllium punctatum]|uniref:Uncharacterized protein n=1 Tax=Chiloscyllium punctatum TaxID=137246 RepID=A0A401T751_CHIPU|nr:hypothetical protein [Chiloscyllium punctatum]
MLLPAALWIHCEHRSLHCVRRSTPLRSSLTHSLTLAMARRYLVTACWIRLCTVMAPFPQGTTTLVLAKQTVTFITPLGNSALLMLHKALVSGAAAESASAQAQNKEGRLAPLPLSLPVARLYLFLLLFCCYSAPCDEMLCFMVVLLGERPRSALTRRRCLPPPVPAVCGSGAECSLHGERTQNQGSKHRATQCLPALAAHGTAKLRVRCSPSATHRQTF